MKSVNINLNFFHTLSEEGIVTDVFCGNEDESYTSSVSWEELIEEVFENGTVRYGKENEKVSGRDFLWMNNLFLSMNKASEKALFRLKGLYNSFDND